MLIILKVTQNQILSKADFILLRNSRYFSFILFLEHTVFTIVIAISKCRSLGCSSETRILLFTMYWSSSIIIIFNSELRIINYCNHKCHIHYTIFIAFCLTWFINSFSDHHNRAVFSWILINHNNYDYNYYYISGNVSWHV